MFHIEEKEFTLFISRTLSESYLFIISIDNRIFILLSQISTDSNAQYPFRFGRIGQRKCVLLELFVHASFASRRRRRRRRTQKHPHYSTLQDDAKRERCLSSSSLSRSFYSTLRDQIEQTFPGNGLRRERFQRNSAGLGEGE